MLKQPDPSPRDEGNVWDGAKVALGIFLDDRADEAQQQALQAIFGGEAGGWPAQFAATVGDLRGMELRPITVEVSDDLSRFSVEVSGRVRAVAEALTGPTTPEGKRVQLLNPPGSEVGPGAGGDVGRRDHGPRRRARTRIHVAVGRAVQQAHPVRLARPGHVMWPATPAGLPRETPGVLDGLSRRVVVVVTLWLLACTVMAWALTIRQASDMTGMASGLAQIGTAAPMAVTGATFMTTWVSMTTAMMFPTAVPMVAAHRMVSRRRGEAAVVTVAFVLGYLAAWTLAGVLPLAALLGFRGLSATADGGRWLPTVAGLAVAATGLYQFTGWKAVCVRTCRSPLAFVMSHDFGGGTSSAVRAGLVYGGYCLGCCWAVMSLLLVVGLMNLVWMSALALVFLAEKCWRHGVGLTRLVGASLIILGAVIVVEPAVLASMAGVGSGEMVKQPGM